MDCIKSHHHSTQSTTTRSKFAKTISKCINNPQTPSRFTPNHTQENPPISKQIRTLSHELNMSIKDIKSNQPKLTKQRSQRSCSGEQQMQQNNNAAKHALLAKLFASLSSIKAAYAELQSAQFPYNDVAIQSADKALVSELIVLSELKQKFIHNDLDLPPSHNVTSLLAEIQEQQSNIKTYEISIKQLESKAKLRDSEISELVKKLNEITKENRSLEKKMNSSGVMSPLLNTNISLSDLNHFHFNRVLHYASRSVMQFAKHLVSKMESKDWSLELAANAIEPNTVFLKPKHLIFALESYISQVMFDGFNHQSFSVQDNTTANEEHPREKYLENFKNFQSLTATEITKQYPNSHFAKYCRSKYLKMVHPKLECSVFGDLDQRKGVSVGAFPNTEFISVFGEMARRIWLLHSLSHSFNPPVTAFQVKKGCRFSEVYMENVDNDSRGGGDGGQMVVGFTVIPGFKIGKMVVQSQVYVSHMVRPDANLGSVWFE